MPDLEQMLAEAQANQKKKKFARGIRPDHLTREPAAPTLPVNNLTHSSTIEKNAIADNSPANKKSDMVYFAIVKTDIEQNAIDNIAIAKNTIEKSAMENITTGDPTVARNAIVGIATAKITTVNNAVVKSGTAKTDLNLTAKSASANTAIAKTTIEPDEVGTRKSTQIEYTAAKTVISSLADKKHGYTRVDNYVFDSLLPSIQNPAAALLYLYLWRRTIGFQKLSVELSHQILSDAIGISKRTVQEAVAFLNEKGLIKTVRAYSTAIPRHTIQKPWATQEEHEYPAVESSIAKNSIAESTTAEDARSYSENCQPAIAESATTKRKVLNKENKSLSLPKLFQERLQSLTESQSKRERDGFENLLNQYPTEGDEIAKALHYLASTGKDLSGLPLRSPIGLMLTNYPQVRDYLREQSNIETGAHIRKQELDLLKAQDLKKEQIEEELFKKREAAFLDAHRTEEEQHSAIKEWGSAAPWIRDKQGPLARHFAINAWASQYEIDL